jgi:nitroreductase
VSPPAVADQHAGAGANSNPASPKRSSNSSSSTSGGNNSSKGSSYSEFYKVVNSRQYGLSSAAGGHFASPGGPSLDTSSSSSSDPSTHQQPQQEQLHQQPGAEVSQAAAAVSGDGHSVGSEAQLQGHLQQQPAGSPDPAGVEDAIRKAQEALAAAETSLSSIHKLRSAQPPSKWSGLLQVLKSLATAAAAGALLVASHAFGLGWQWAGATIGALALAGAWAGWEECKCHSASQQQLGFVSPFTAAEAALACAELVGRSRVSLMHICIVVALTCWLQCSKI